MTVYTKKGDKGKTTVNNVHLAKNDALLKVLGNLDELNSSLGLLHTIRNKKIRIIILDLQKDLFSIGADLASRKKAFAYEGCTEELERKIDDLSKSLPPLRNFILPGGSKNAAQLQISRSVARRLERSIVSLKKTGKYNELPLLQVVKYTNRLSDLLFVMARYVNFKLGIKEIIWPHKE